MPDTTAIPQGTGAAGTAGLAATLPIYHQRKLLDYLKPLLRYAEFGMPDNVPLRQGTQIIWTKYQRTTATVANATLTEGQTPASTAMSSTGITGALLQYGVYTLKSDFVIDTSFDAQIPTAVEHLSFLADEVIDTLILNELTASCLVSGSTGNLIIPRAHSTPALSTVASTSTMQAVDLLAARVKLRKNMVLPFKGQDYGAVLAAPCVFDLQADTSAGGWLDIFKYNHELTLINGELGKVHGVRLTDTHNYYSTTVGTSASATGYANFVFGRDSFGTVKLGMQNSRIVIKRAASNGVDDPLEQRNSVGFKFAYDVKYLKTTLTGDNHPVATIFAATLAP